jgi:short subunit dehydrogenase-like uncharacterized protein
MSEWMLYGAYGYTGKLLVKEAIKRGHRPLLAGRNTQKLQALAEEFSLNYSTLKLEDEAGLTAAVTGVELVFHAAGPFIHTAEPMIQACITGQTHYLDITGEVSVFQTTYNYHHQAQASGIALISGAGFDVIPSDCLAKYVVEQVPGAKDLEIAIVALGKTSPGTAKTFIEMLPQGGWTRRNGEIVSLSFGTGVKQVPFPNDKSYTVMAVPWGDLSTAFWGMAIPNITTYLALPRRLLTLVPWTAPIVQKLMAPGPARDMAKMVAGTLRGPDRATRRTKRSYIWARATDGQGNAKEAWLETMEAYRLTALAGIRSVEKMLAQDLSGALTPAQAFGADFILEFDDTKRFDSLMESSD